VDSAIARLGGATAALGVRVWTGRGKSSHPRRDDSEVVARFGEDLALELLPVIRAIEEAFYKSEAHRNVADLGEAGRVAAAEFCTRFPMLPASVAEDLAWCYTYDYR
jgi:hypothetical protein